MQGIILDGGIGTRLYQLERLCNCHSRLKLMNKWIIPKLNYRMGTGYE